MLTQDELWDIRDRFHGLPMCIERNTRIDVGEYQCEKFYSHRDIIEILSSFTIKESVNIESQALEN